MKLSALCRSVCHGPCRNSTRGPGHYRHAINAQAACSFPGLADPHEGSAHHRPKTPGQHRRFNESAFCSTRRSPLFASLDVGAQMMMKAVPAKCCGMIRLALGIELARRSGRCGGSLRKGTPARAPLVLQSVPDRVAMPDVASPGASTTCHGSVATGRCHQPPRHSPRGPHGTAFPIWRRASR